MHSSRRAGLHPPSSAGSQAAHDPTTVIKAKTAIGVGAYGSVRGNPALPPVGSAIELIVEAANSGK